MDMRRIEHDDNHVRYFYKKLSGYYNETNKEITRYDSMQGYSANFELQNELRNSWIPDFNLHVKDYFEHYYSQALRTEFLRSVFGNRERDFEGIFFDKCRLISDENGIRLQNFTKEFEASWDWNEIEHRIDIMIRDHQFLDYDDQMAYQRLEKKNFNYDKLTPEDRTFLGRDPERPVPRRYAEERESVRKKLKVADNRKRDQRSLPKEALAEKTKPIKKGDLSL